MIFDVPFKRYQKNRKLQKFYKIVIIGSEKVQFFNNGDF